jgi:hypothetical protein
MAAAETNTSPEAPRKQRRLGHKIGIRDVEKLQPGDPIVWDDGKGSVVGFGIRRQSGTAVSYVLRYRTNTGGEPLITIGKHRQARVTMGA